MVIPTGVVMPIAIASFLVLLFQYWRINPEKRLLNLQFPLMIGALALMVLEISFAGQSVTLVFFLLASLVLAIAVFLLRFLPPPRS